MVLGCQIDWINAQKPKDFNAWWHTELHKKTRPTWNLDSLSATTGNLQIIYGMKRRL